MLKAEFDRIMGLFAECSEGKPISVETVFRESMVFFEKVNEILRQGSPPEKQEALVMMGEMYRSMTETGQKLAKETGLSDEQLAKLSENPGNFSQEQWKSMQAAKERMASLSQDLIETLKSLNPNHKIVTKQTEGDKSATVAPKKKKTRSDWMKS